MPQDSGRAIGATSQVRRGAAAACSPDLMFAARTPIASSTIWTGADFFNSGDWTFIDRPAGDTGDGSRGYYRPANITLAGGVLQLQARKETSGSPPNVRAYTSGSMIWTNRSFLYGTLEIRAKFAGADGLSPALWLLGVNCESTYPITEDNTGACQWPNPGSDEIDFAEILVGTIDHVNFQIHSTTSNAQIFYNAGVDLSAAYHTYKMVWTPTSLAWTFDGVNAGSITSPGSTIPSTAMFLIMNVAAGPLGAVVNDSALPQNMLVDYVKVTPP